MTADNGNDARQARRHAHTIVEQVQLANSADFTDFRKAHVGLMVVRQAHPGKLDHEGKYRQAVSGPQQGVKRAIGQMPKGHLDEADADGISPCHGPKVLKIQKLLAGAWDDAVTFRHVSVALLQQKHQSHHKPVYQQGHNGDRPRKLHFATPQKGLSTSMGSRVLPIYLIISYFVLFVKSLSCPIFLIKYIHYGTTKSVQSKRN